MVGGSLELASIGGHGAMGGALMGDPASEAREASVLSARRIVSGGLGDHFRARWRLV
jgi:hypothetical protein